MTPLDLATVHQHDKTGSLPIVSRALLECEARAKRLEEALRGLTFAARTSGGVAGRDNDLCAACEAAERLLNGE
jgi:hypothetical protein